MLGPILGGLGTVGGALGGVALAGKYAPQLGQDVVDLATKLKKGTSKRVREFASSMPQGVRNTDDFADAPNYKPSAPSAARDARGVVSGLAKNIRQVDVDMLRPIVDTAVPGLIGATTGGVALSALGNAIDPEQYGTSNTRNSLYQMQGDLSRMM
tara:strand:+ start:33 stop:497 length:465 start_codon:yes stop_codon:yes gene_type:complete